MRTDSKATSAQGVRNKISMVLLCVEDIIYVGLAVLLAASAFYLLSATALELVRTVGAETTSHAIVNLLDRMLLVLMIVELLYTVQVSFRQHALLPEPFLLVGLIAVVRRILVITAEFGAIVELESEIFQRVLIELGLLTLLILVLVASLILLRAYYGTPSSARPD